MFESLIDITHDQIDLVYPQLKDLFISSISLRRRKWLFAASSHSCKTPLPYHTENGSRTMIVLSKPTLLSSPFTGCGATTSSLHLSSPPPFLDDDLEPRIEPQAGPSRGTATLRTRLRDTSALLIAGQSDSEDDDDDEYVQSGEVRSINSPSRARAQTKTPGKRSRSQSVIGAEERGERLLACEHEGCGRLFLKPSKLREHALSHTGEVSIGD